MSESPEEFPGTQEAFDDMHRQLSATQDKIISLESDIERLKNFIRQAVEIGPNNCREMQGWEVMTILAYWVQE